MRCGSRRRWRSPAGRPSRAQYLASSVAQFWDAVDRIFELARAGREDEARAQIRLSLQARQAALSTAVARLLVQNNESEEQTAQQVQDIYAQRAAAGVLVPGRHAGGDRGDQPVPDSLEPAAVRASSPRCRTSGASWRRS